MLYSYTLLLMLHTSENDVYYRKYICIYYIDNVTYY